MSKKYWEGQYDINTDWGGDESTGGLPLPGSAVQDVVKTSIKTLDEGKVGYIKEKDGTIYFSSTKDAFDNEKYMGSVLATQIYTLDLKKDSSNKTLYLSGDANKKFIWYFKSIEIATESVLVESVSVEYRLENTTNGTSRIITKTLECKNDSNDEYTKVEEDLDSLITDGRTNVEIIVKGLRTKVERTLQESFTVITLDIEDATEFQNPYKNTLFLLTNINATDGQNYYYEYKFDDADTFIYDIQSYNGSFKPKQYGIDISELSYGKHSIEYRLQTNLLDGIKHYTKTQRIEFIKAESDAEFDEPQLMIFSTYSDGETPIADDNNLIINGVSQYVESKIKYAVYNNAPTYIEFHDVTDGGDIVIAKDTVSRGNINELQLQSNESGSKTIKVICKNESDEITNGDGRIFYINVAKSTLNISEFNTNLRIDFSTIGKSNDSIDKDVWVSEIPERNFRNQATFSETFDWSQGWTENGLVLSEGCEVVFDYVPFPQQKSSDSNDKKIDYVGGNNAYSFELEFMTQNVTDENAVLCNMLNEASTNNCGLLITGSEIRFNTPNGTSVSTRFKEGEMNRIAIVVRPATATNGSFKGLVELYINGVMSNIAKYNFDSAFEVYENVNDSLIPKTLRFNGAKGADLVIKYIRAYNQIAMSPDNIVDNYIIYRTNSQEMLSLYNNNNILENGNVTPSSVLALGDIPVLIFVGRTVSEELATGDGNYDGFDGTNENYPDGYLPGSNEDASETNWYGTLEGTTNKKDKVNMDVIYVNPKDPTKNFKFVKAYITPQGTSSMYYPKKNYRIYTQKNDDTRMFLSIDKNNTLDFDDMIRSNFGEEAEDRVYEVHRGIKNKEKRVYKFKDNAQPVKCWCLKADFAETSSSHNTGVARLWGEVMKTASVTIDNNKYNVFKTNAQDAIEEKYKGDTENMPDIRTTIDGFPIVVFGKRSYNGRIVDGKLVEDPFVFLGKYNFNNDKSTESVFGFCDIDNEVPITDVSYDYVNEVSGTVTHTLDKQLDKYMTCVETLDNGNALANFANSTDVWNNVTIDNDGEEMEEWKRAFEFRYPEIPEKPKDSEYRDSNGNWIEGGQEEFNSAVKEFEEETMPYWENTHLKPFRHFAEWVYSTRWCDVYGNKLEELTDEEAAARKQKFAEEKWKHIDVWKVAAYYIYIMRFGAVDQVVKNSMLTSEGPFAYNKNGAKYGEWDSTDVNSELYGQYYKWYYINYDNDTVLGVKNDGSLAYGPEITRQDFEGDETNSTPIYAGSTSVLWNNIENDDEFQSIIRIADRGISETMTYSKTIEMFDVEQVGQWCERIYNKDAEYKYISPYIGDWAYSGETSEKFVDKLFMLQGSRTAHRRWWLSRRFNLLDGKWSSGEFASKYVEVKCNYGSIGDKFSAVAGANAYFGYQINSMTFGDAVGGVTQKYEANSTINWELKKVINIGDPIAIYGANDLLELNLCGISKNLTSVGFIFGSNADLGNKLENFYISIPEEELMSAASYKTYTDFEDVQKLHPFEITTEDDIPVSEEMYDATESGSPEYFKMLTVNDEGEEEVVYFSKIETGMRNYSCTSISLDNLNKLQSLKVAGYLSLTDLNLTNNPFITDVDARYTAISNISFADGCRINELKVSTALKTLKLTRCDNLKLENIYVDSKSLKEDGGKNISVIEIDNSDGLNKSNDFRDFILNWITVGKISEKKLILKDIKWTNVMLADIDALKAFEASALDCEITGVIEMGNDKLLSSDLETLEQLSQDLGGGLTFRFPYANIVISGDKSEIVAGESVNYTYLLFPDSNTVVSGGGYVTYNFVEIVDEVDENTVYDSRTGLYYRILENSDEVSSAIRPGLSIIGNDDGFGFTVNTTENINGKDTNALVMAKLTYDGGEYFDVAKLLIKEPTYAVNGNINGVKNIGSKNTSYTYTLSIISNKGDEPIGTFDINWSISGNNFSGYFRTFEISEDKRTYTITTSDTQPDITDNLKIVVTITNDAASSSVVPPISESITIEKELLLLNEDVVLTEETNPVVFGICKKMDWATKSEIVMTRAEAEAVTSIGSAFTSVVSSGEGWTFDEFMYFTNAELTSLDDGAFSGSNITSIVLPNNIKTLGDGVFKNCSKLKNVELGNGGISEIPQETFLGCESLVNFILPDSVVEIKKYAFGGTNIEKIKQNTNNIVEEEKTILLGKNTKLKIINAHSFETENWSIDTTTNKLRDIFIPKSLSLSESTYDFTLGKNLETITIEDGHANIGFDQNMLYANTTKTMLVRALPKANEENVLSAATAENVITIYPYAFYNCDTIKKITLGNQLASYGLGNGVFYGSSIETVDLSLCKNLAQLPSKTFENCIKLSDVILPIDGNLINFGSELFVNCSALTSITIPNTVVEFMRNGDDSDTFKNCALTELVLPQSLTTTGRYVVNSCPYLTKITFPDMFTLRLGMFKECPSLVEVVTPIFSYSANTYVVNDGTTEIGRFETYDGALLAASGNEGYVTTIESDIMVNRNFGADFQLFEGCMNVEKITINERDTGKIMKTDDNKILYKIGDIDTEGNYYDYEKTLSFIVPTLSAITIDTDTEVIGIHCFTQSPKLSAVTIPSGVKKIEQYAFSSKNCGIQNLTIPSTVESIGEHCFAESCGIQNLTIPSTVKSIGVNCFEQSNLKTLEVLAEGIEIPSHMAFSCSMLEKVLLYNVSSINSFAFVNCKNLRELVVLNTIAPEILSDNYHPFGYRSGNQMGLEVDSSLKKIAYFPYNSSGYDSDIWQKPLIGEKIDDKGNAFSCKFTKEFYPLTDICVLKVYDTNGSLVDTGATLYFKSESEDFVFENNIPQSSTYDAEMGGFKVNFNGKVYDNENISVYLDSGLTNKLGEFTAKYGVKEYTVGEAVLSYSTRNTFASGLFGTSQTETKEVEMANITKSEYERLVSKVYQLTEIVNKLNKL